MGGGGAANKRRKDKEKAKEATHKANEEFLGIRYGSYIRADQPKNAVVVRRLGSTGEFVKDHGVDRRVIRKGAVVKPDVLREAYIVQNFQFILRPECFYVPTTVSSGVASSASSLCSAAGEERSALVAQGLVDDFPMTATDTASRNQHITALTNAMGSFGAKIHWRHVIALSTRLDVDDIRCPICFESPTAPRVTPCGHVFCFHCILRSMNAQKRLGIGYNGGQTPATTNMGAGVVMVGGGGTSNSASASANASGSAAAATTAVVSSHNSNSLGSADAYGARPRTCPLCGSGIDLQGLRPCFIHPSEPLTEAAVKAQPMRTFALGCRNFQTPVVLPAGGGGEAEGAPLATGKSSANNDDPSPATVAATLLSSPHFIPTYGTAISRFSRYAHATTDLLREQFQTEITDVERQLRVLVEDRPDPAAPLDEGEEYEHNALQGVFRHLSTYGYSTISTANCENPNAHLHHHHHNKNGVNLAAKGVTSAPAMGGGGGASPASAPASREVSTTSFTIHNNIHTIMKSRASVAAAAAAASGTASVASHQLQIQQQRSAAGGAANANNFNGSASPSPVAAIANNNAASPLVWLYRLEDGQNVYLHPLNVRMLLKQAEINAERAWSEKQQQQQQSSPPPPHANAQQQFSAEEKEEALMLFASHLPPTITARVLDMEIFTQQAAKPPRLFAHVPPHAAFTEAFVDLTSVVSKEVMSMFKQPLMERLKDVHRKRRRAEGEERLMRDEGGVGVDYCGGGGGGGSSSNRYGSHSAAYSTAYSTRSNNTDTTNAARAASHIVSDDGTIPTSTGGDHYGDGEEDEWWEGEDEEWWEEGEDDEEEGAGGYHPRALTADAVASAAASGAAMVPAHSSATSSSGPAAGIGLGGGPSSWVDAHTTPTAVASYLAREGQVLTHPDELRGGSQQQAAAVSAAATDAVVEKLMHDNSAVDTTTIADHGKSGAGGREKNKKGRNSKGAGRADDGYHHHDEDDDDDHYYYGDDHDADEGLGVGGGSRNRHRNLFSGASAPSDVKQSRGSPSGSPIAVLPSSSATVNPIASSAAAAANESSCLSKKKKGKPIPNPPPVSTPHPQPQPQRPISEFAASTGFGGVNPHGGSDGHALAAEEDDMAALLAAMGDLTEEEQLWLLQEQEREKEERRVRAMIGSHVHVSDIGAWDTPELESQWGGSSSNTNKKGNQNNAPTNAAMAGKTPPKASGWGQKGPRHFDAEAFPDLLGGGGGGGAAVSASAASSQQQQPSLAAAAMSSVSTTRKTNNGAGAKAPSNSAAGGWTTVSAQPPRRSWKDDANDDLDAYFKPKPQQQQQQGDGIADSTTAPAANAWGKRR